MSVFQSQQPIIIPDPAKDLPPTPAGPSSSNIVYYGTPQGGGTSGQYPITSLAVGSNFQFKQIPNTFFPDSNSTYLLNANFDFPSGTFAASATGQLTVTVQYGVGVTLAVADLPVSGVTSWTLLTNPDFNSSLTTIFKRQPGADSLDFYIANLTNQVLNTGNFKFTNVGIAALSTSNVNTTFPG
jgi:hypothetical protein